MALTDEQIKEALKHADIKKAIETAVDEAVDGLKTKNTELLGTVKDLKKKFDVIEEEKAAAEEKAAMSSGDAEKIKTQYEKKLNEATAKIKADAEAAIKEANDKANNDRALLNTKIIGEGLTQALLKAKIMPDHLDAVEALIKTKHKGEVFDDNGKPIAKFDGKAIDEFVSGWAQSDVGKRYVAADSNTGGGSNGANGKGKADTGTKKTMSRSEFEGLSVSEKSKFSIGGGTLTD